jgi:hypothetical protein
MYTLIGIYRRLIINIESLGVFARMDIFQIPNT